MGLKGVLFFFLTFLFLFLISISSFAFTPFGDIACKELDVWV